MWQSQVENVHYSYCFLTTFFWLCNVITLSVSVPESSNLIFGNSYLSKYTSSKSNLIEPIKNRIMYVFYLWLPHISILFSLSLIDSAKLVTLLSLELELRRTFQLIHGLYAVFAKGVMNLYNDEAPPPTTSKVNKINYSWSLRVLELHIP